MCNYLHNQKSFVFLLHQTNQQLKKQIMTKQDLINEIIPMIQNSHNEKDIIDLHTFDIDELNEILTDLKQN